MPDFSSIDIAFAFNGFYLVAGFILFGLLSFFVYRYTIPAISTPLRWSLIVLRTVALVLIFLAIFEPVVSVSTRNEITPVNIIAIDNSTSLTVHDSSAISGFTGSFLGNVMGSGTDYKIIAFGDSVREIDGSDGINFTDKSTNIEELFTSLSRTEKNISSLTIISDGIINEGGTPVYVAEKAGYPVNTIGTGDTTTQNDISISRVVNNEIIYVNSPTTIVVSVKSEGFSVHESVLELYEEDKLVDRKTLNITGGGLDKVEFTYTPESAGNKRLLVSTPVLQEENNPHNNKKVFFVDVRDNKLQVLLATGSPSVDYTFLKNSIAADENYEILNYAKVSSDFIAGGNNLAAKLDSADILVLSGFPGEYTTNEEINTIKEKIRRDKLPFIFIVSTGADFRKLSGFDDILPVSVGNYQPGYSTVQPDITLESSSLLYNNASDPIQAWNTLPPVNMPNTTISVKPGNQIISKVTSKGTPENKILIVSGSQGGIRSLFINAAGIWKWKLQRAKDNARVFDNFINNTLKWLSVPDDKKQVIISTSRKVYSAGETVEFSAQVYDESFNPVSDAEVEVIVKGNGNNITSTLSAVNTGIYEGDINVTLPGYYNYSGSASVNGSIIGTDEGSFSIGEVNPELENNRMNIELLKRLALISGGDYYTPENSDELIARLTNSDNTEQFTVSTAEIKLWSEEYLLYLIIILFSLEWFLRKRAGML